MHRLNLHFLRRDCRTLGADQVYYERIKALLAIGPSGQVKQDCLIDPGAPLSVFPQRQWERFATHITWLYQPGSRPDLPDWLTKVTGLGAQPVDCRIGKLKLRIIELPLTATPKWSPVVEIIGKFPEDNGAYPQILLGLGGGVFSSWKLVIDYPHYQAWLEY